MKPWMLTLLLMLGMAWAAVADAAPVAIDLSVAQRSDVLDEAQTAFERGMSLRETDAPASRQAFKEAAAKFELVATTGGDQGPLFFNLANAYLMAGQPGHAIANYHRADGVMPGDARVAANLALARTMVEPGPTIAEPSFLTRNIGIALTDAAMWVGLVAWCLLWIGLACAVIWRMRFIRYAIVPTAVVSLLAFGWVVYDTWQRPDAPRVVIVADTTLPRTGDGDTFAAMEGLSLQEGSEFTLIDRRNRWLRIELASGRTGWVPAGDVEVVGAGPGSVIQM